MKIIEDQLKVTGKGFYMAIKISRGRLMACFEDITEVLDLGPDPNSIFKEIDFHKFTNEQLANQIFIDSECFDRTLTFKEDTIKVLHELGIDFPPIRSGRD